MMPAVPRQVESHGAIDQAIDRAVREMMEVDADAAFRARVLARLATPKPVTWWRTVAVSAAAASLVLAVLVFRPAGPRPDAPSARPKNTTGTAARNSETAPQPVRVPVQPRVNRGDAARPTRAPTVMATVPLNASTSVPAGMVVATVAAAEPDRALEALDPIEPITIAPLEPEAIVPQAIVIPPLAPITEMQITPLSQAVDRN
jgi:hypothetical protein